MINSYDNTCDVAVIWSVLWQGRMAGNKKVWDDFRSQGKPVVVLEVGGLLRNIPGKWASMVLTEMLILPIKPTTIKDGLCLN
jgi:hypothetical protein